MSQLKVNTIRHTGASSDAVTLASDGTCTAKITNNLSNRNLIINGAMQVAQYGTSSGSSGFKTVDRWQMSAGGANAALTQSHHALTSSDTGPWAEGFRHSFHILNAGQSGPDANDNCEIPYCIEAQDLATCGWDYTSASSYVTVSFWIKSSVAQNFYAFLYTRDGTMKTYPFETGSLTADTWTKVTKTIPGHSDISFVNDNGQGMYVDIVPYYGTNYTDSGVSLNTWKTKDSDVLPVNTSTWWTTSNSTIEITGVQLEVGGVATDFEHRSYADELLRCQRYYEHSYNTGVAAGSNSNVGGYYECLSSDSAGNAVVSIEYKVQKRAVPTMAFYRDNSTSGQWDFSGDGVSAGANTVTGHRNSQTHLNCYLNIGANWKACYLYGHWTSSSEL